MRPAQGHVWRIMDTERATVTGPATARPLQAHPLDLGYGHDIPDSDADAYNMCAVAFWASFSVLNFSSPSSRTTLLTILVLIVLYLGS